MNDGYQLVYPDCIRNLVDKSANCPISVAALSWIVLRLNYSYVPSLSGVSFDVVAVHYPGKHLTIGAKFQDTSSDREFAIVTLVEHLLNTLPSREFFDFAMQNPNWQLEIDRLSHSGE